MPEYRLTINAPATDQIWNDDVHVGTYESIAECVISTEKWMRKHPGWIKEIEHIHITKIER
tara:strand:- start:92 stop:274 length:183 start_codon:yes stop_codon:yes gene_type:complete